MTIASSNFTSMAYAEETEYGVVPAAQFRPIPFTGESLQFTKDSIKSNNINPSRQVSDTIQTGFNVSGGIDIELAPKIFDEFIEGTLWARWSDPVAIDYDDADEWSWTASTKTLVLTVAESTLEDVSAGDFVQIRNILDSDGSASGFNGINQVVSATTTTVVFKTAIGFPSSDATHADYAGSTMKIRSSTIRNPSTSATATANRISYYFEKTLADTQDADNSNQPYRFGYDGCMINSWNVNAQASSILTSSFDFMGSESSGYANGTGPDGSKSNGAYLTQVAANILNAVSHIKGVRINDEDVYEAAAKIYFQGLDFSIGNNLRGVQAISTMGNVDVLPGQFEVTGSMNAYFATNAMYNRFVNGDEFSIAYPVLNEDGEGYMFYFPRAAVSSSTMSASGNDQDLVEQMQWAAMMKDPTDELTPSVSVVISRFYDDYTDAPDQ